MRPVVVNGIEEDKEFQSTHPLRDATSSVININFCIYNFNPRTPYGMRRISVEEVMQITKFQSTHPLRDATFLACGSSTKMLFQSTHPLRDATNCDNDYINKVNISIHAPLTGCDVCKQAIKIK